eukprot:g3763.t1
MMYRLIRIFLASFYFLAVAVAGEPTSALTSDNFDISLLSHKYVLVVFYAPWCTHCKKFMPEFERVAKVTPKSRDVLFGKVDIVKETAIAKRYKVKGFPTLKWFIDGHDQTPKTHDIPREKKELIKWLRKVAVPFMKMLSDQEMVDRFKFEVRHSVGSFRQIEADSFYKKDLIPIVAFANLKGAPLNNAFESACRNFASFVSCAVATFPFVADDEDVRESYSIVMYRSDDSLTINDELVVYEGRLDSYSDIEAWVRVQSLPLILDFSLEVQNKIYESGIARHLLVFGEKGSDAELVARELARQYRGTVLFVLVPPSASRILSFFRIVPGDYPSIRMIDTSRGKIRKFIFDEDRIDGDSLNRFIEGVLSETIGAEYRSLAIPKENTNVPVVEVVGASFDSIVLDPDKSAVVFFYTPYCGHCKLIENMWRDVANVFQNEGDIVVAQMNGAANEHEAAEFITSYPTIAFWGMSNETRAQAVFSGPRRKDILISFVRDRLYLSRRRGEL